MLKVLPSHHLSSVLCLIVHHSASSSATASIPRPAYHRHNRMFENSLGQMIRYTQYRGYGNPLETIGHLGDIFIDITQGAYRVFVKYESWFEWKGIQCRRGRQQNVEQIFLHPRNQNLRIWITAADVLWMKRLSIERELKHMVFCRFSESFVTARQLIEDTTTLEDEIACVQRRERISCHLQDSQPSQSRKRHRSQ